jgi:hypothetical protein
MKALFFEFLLYVYVNHIVEDWDTCTKLGKIYYYPFWFIRSVLVWIISPILIVPFLIERSKTYQDFKIKLELYMKQ